MAARRPRRLRQKLFMIFLGLAVVPSLLLAGLAYHFLDASLELWRTPGVSRALEGSLGVARQVLEDRRPELERELEVVLSGPTRARSRAAAAESLSAALARSSFDALGLSDAAHFGKLRWTARPGYVLLGEVIERRLSGMPRDTLVVAGPEHIALIRTVAGRRWIALADLPEGIRGELADILEAQALYDQLGDYRTVARGGLAAATGATIVLVILLSWVAAWILAPRVTRPLEALAAAMGAFSRGEPSRPVEATESEVRELAGAFEAMRRDLEASRIDLARAERAAAWREVARRIAHEIKNPLTPIRLAVHRLRGLEEQLPAAERARLVESLDSVDREVESLRGMADAFSRFSRLPEPERRPTAVAPVVRSVAEMYQGGDLRLECRVPDDLVANLDEAQTRQALHNLIQNASDAMAGSGPVRIDVVPEPRHDRPGVRFTVTDEGPGFDPEALERAGQPYFTQKTHGTGLGLAMVRRIVEGHGGQMEIGNAAGPAGARVTFWVPAAEERA